MTRFNAGLLAFAGGASYGLLSGFTKKAYQASVPTGALTTVQLIVGCVILWGMAILISDTGPKPTKVQIIKLLLVGTLPGLTGVFYYLSLKILPASIAIILLFQFTWMGALFDYIFDKRKPTATELTAILFVIPGTFLAIGNLSDISSLSWEGLFLGIASALTYTGFLYCTGRVAPDISPWIRSPLIITGSLIITVIIFRPFSFEETFLFRDVLLWGGLMGVFGPVIPTICLTFGVPVIGGGLAAILGSVELPIVLAVAYFSLGEQVSALQWLGAVIILVGIYWGNRDSVGTEEQSLS